MGRWIAAGIIGSLAFIGTLTVCWVVSGWAERAADWLRRDRVTPLLEEDDTCWITRLNGSQELCRFQPIGHPGPHEPADDITGWDKIWIKINQADTDALLRGLEDSCVWKKRNGRTDPGEGAVMMPARRFFPLMMRLERLERLELEAAEAYDRGYRNGARGAERDRQEAL